MNLVTRKKTIAASEGGVPGFAGSGGGEALATTGG